jgi:hypothetical protein
MRGRFEMEISILGKILFIVCAIAPLSTCLVLVILMQRGMANDVDEKDEDEEVRIIYSGDDCPNCERGKLEHHSRYAILGNMYIYKICCLCGNVTYYSRKMDLEEMKKYPRIGEC